MSFNFTLLASNPIKSNNTVQEKEEKPFSIEEYAQVFDGTEIATEVIDEVYGTEEYKAVKEYALLFDIPEEEAANVLGDIYTDNDFSGNRWTI